MRRAVQSKLKMGVKIEGKHSRIVVACIFCLFFSKLIAGNVDKCEIIHRNNPQIAQKINHGVNLSLLEHTWEPAEELLNHDLSPQLHAIKADGFLSVRLPVAFDMYLLPNSSNFQPRLIDKLGEAYNTCAKLGLSLIITYHYGKVYYGSDNRWSERDRIMWMWKQLQNKFRGMGYDNLFFELYNEPTEERSAWKEDVTYLVNGLRWEEKDRYYIIGGTNYNNIDELLDLGKLSDEKLFYTIHFYEPYLFTHQGAEWVKDRTELSNIPYPYSKRKMPPLKDSTKGTAVEQDFAKYPAEGTKQFLALRLRKVKEACNKLNMTLVCTETGVINSAEEKFRENYLKDILDIMRNLGIPTMLWDYDLKFGLRNKDGKLLKPVRNWLE